MTSSRPPTPSSSSRRPHDRSPRAARRTGPRARISRGRLEPRLRRAGLRAAAALAAVLALWIGSGVLGALVLTHRRRAPFAEPAPEGFSSLRLRAADGIGIGAWLAEGDGDRASVVLAHGNGASRSALLDEARAFRALGCTALAISVRAHGDSGGDSNDVGWSARLDVAAAVRFLRERAPPRPIVVFGASLGAAASIFAAGEIGEAIHGYVLVAPYADLRLAVRRRTQRYLAPGLDDLAYGALLLGGRVVLPDLDRIRPADTARAIRSDAPVLVFAGGSDERAPVSDARAIVAGLPRARVVVVPDADHEDVGAFVTTGEGLGVIRALLDEVARGRAGP